MASPPLSVLDLVPVREDQSTADALAATRRLARVADELGFRRYWLAEHQHAGGRRDQPAGLVAMVAAATDRIRVGSGGVMLPNHAPLVVAEQFALLKAAHPGRDRPGWTGARHRPGHRPGRCGTAADGVDDDAVERFPEYVDNITAMLSPEGAGLRPGQRDPRLRATPRARPPCPASGSSARPTLGRLAAEKRSAVRLRPPLLGAGHCRGARALPRRFPAVVAQAEPQTFLTVNAVVAPTQEEADRLALPNLRAMVALRTGQPLPRTAAGGGGRGDRPDPRPTGPGTGRCWSLGGRDTGVAADAAARARRPPSASTR